jgi:hypothetical protein
MSKKPLMGDAIAAKHDDKKVYLILKETTKGVGTSFTLLRLQDRVIVRTPFLTESHMETYFEVLANAEIK